SASFAPAGAINGDRKGVNWGNGGGWNDGTPNAFPDWLQVTFNGSKTIGEIDVFSVEDNSQAPADPTPSLISTLYGLVDFQVQYLNGSTWVDVPGGNITGNNLVWRRVSFAPVTTTAIRVLVNAIQGGGWSAITELEAWTQTGPTYSVSGTVSLGGMPLAGVTFAAPGGGNCTVSDGQGNYS